MPTMASMISFYWHDNLGPFSPGGFEKKLVSGFNAETRTATFLKPLFRSISGLRLQGYSRTTF